MSNVSRANAMSSNESGSNETVRPIPRSAQQRRASDTNPPSPTIDSVRELLLGDTIKQSRRELDSIERKTHNQLGELRVELGDRIDRVVRALSTVNQSVHKEFGAREQAIRESSEEISTRMEDRLSFLEAKIYTVVADMERKVSATHTADNDKLIEQLAEANARTEANIVALTEKFEQQLNAFGSRITTEIAAVNEKVTAARAETGNELESAGSKMGEQLGEAENRLKAELGELRDELCNSSVKLQQEMARRASEQQTTIARSEANTQATLRNHLQNLEGRKVSRNDFSTLLHELAARLDEPSADNRVEADDKG